MAIHAIHTILTAILATTAGTKANMDCDPGMTRSYPTGLADGWTGHNVDSATLTELLALRKDLKMSAHNVGFMEIPGGRIAIRREAVTV